MTKRAFWGFVLMCTLSGLLWAKESSSQNLRQSIIYLSQQKTTLIELLNAIEAQTSYVFSYSKETENLPVSLRVGNQRLDQVLMNVSAQTQLAFHRIGEMIAVEQREREENQDKSLVIALTVSGQVTDQETGDPLPGVNVLVKGSNQGTITDIDGNYSIGIPNDDDTLIFSFVGYQTWEASVEGRTTLDVQLATNTQSLNEVMVVGYGIQKKVNLTGAVDMVNEEVIENRPATFTSNLLQGLVPGVTVTNYTGMPGQGTGNIRIRGISTLNNTSPLVLIDGIEGDMNNLNPGDVESISVLKDAASASIYGSRAGNGVILITTKSGKTSKSPQISINSYYGVQTPTRLPKFLGSVEYMQMLNEAQRNVGRPATFTNEDIQVAREGSDPNYFANTDWVDAIYRDYAPQQSHNISVNGGAENLKYYLSYGYLDQEGLIVGNSFGFGRHNLRMRLNSTLLDVVDVDAIVGYVDREYYSPQWATTSSGGVIRGAHSISPLIPVRFTNGAWGYGGGANNPVAIAHDGGSNIFHSGELTANIRGTVKLTDHLKLTGQFGVVNTNSKREVFVKKVTYTRPDDGSYWYANTDRNQLDNRDYIDQYRNLNLRMDYKQSFGQHNLQLMGGYSQESTAYDYFSASRQEFLTEEVPVLNIGAENQRSSGDAYHWAIRSVFGRLNYDFNNKYLLEVNARYDGSSRFAADKRWGLFPSVSAGWRFTEEDFLQGIKSVVEEGKIRASWGNIGNQWGVNGAAYSEYYPYIPVINAVGTMPIGNELTAAFAQTVLANTNLTWETATMTNLGLDLYFLDNRLSFTGDIYRKRTKDILIKVPLPAVVGLQVPDQNAGIVENRGWEVNLGWQDSKGDFNYSLNFNLADVKNEVISLGDAPPSYGTQIRAVGYPIDAYYGLVANRLAQESDFTYNAETDTYTPNFPVFESDATRISPGDLLYEDLNGDGEVTMEDDRQVLGNPFPRYTYGLQANMGWRNLDFSFFLQGVGKATGYIYDQARHAYKNESTYPQEIHRDRWTPENTDATYPRFTYQETYNTRVSSYWLEDASYLRLKNIQLGYTFPKVWTEKIRMSKLRLYMSAENLLTATDFFYGYDPETPLASGGYYPQVKTFVFGINANLQ